MDARNTNRYTMLLAVQQYLDNNPTPWSSLPIATMLKNEFDALLTETQINLQATNDPSGGLTVNKNTLRNQIAIKAARFAGALKAYANINDNADLAAKADLNKSEVTRTRDADLPPKLQKLLALLEAEKANLVDFGVVDAQLTELATSVDDFRQLIGQPRLRQSEARVANRNAEEALNEAIALLNKKLDNVMLMFEGSEASFFQGYEAARVIVD